MAAPAISVLRCLGELLLLNLGMSVKQRKRLTAVGFFLRFNSSLFLKMLLIGSNCP